MAHVGSSHNRSAKPFGAPGGSSVATESHISIRDSFPDSASHPDAHGRNQVGHLRINKSYIRNLPASIL